ncbi:hypothetical protein D3OALGA1CA_1434 [Olavius algarvensis associated proteobacterium Delta 3]|nr:hypothetical protein D3OALGA1CA_1434 [Olavius algarvensis associated proteobacterium Delta 3]
MNLIRRIITANTPRKTRLHDEKGNFLGWRNLFLHSLPVTFSGLLRISIGYRVELPWTPFSAINCLRFNLKENARILEFGSGMSTIYFCKHCKEVFSVEDYRPWYLKISKIIERKGINNIVYKFAENKKEYFSFMADDNRGFDLITIDGSHRSQCACYSTKLIKPGGVLYLDDSDRESIHGNKDNKIAETLLRNFAKKSDAEVHEFTDFSPTQFYVKQGICVKLTS